MNFVSPADPIITSALGQQFCAWHHVPLLSVHGYTTRKHPEEVTLFDPEGEERTVEANNPNFIPFDKSLRRHGRYQHPCKITYCPRCEAAVAATEATGVFSREF